MNPAFWAGSIPSAASVQSIKMVSQVAPQTAARSINIEKLRVYATKNKVAERKRQRMVLVTNLLLRRSELIRGYHLPENYLEGFYFRRIYPYQSDPTYTPDKESDKYLYRGMLLTPEELAKILRVGFSPATSTWNAGTSKGNTVSLSSSMVEASHYIFQSGGKKEGIGVVFKVRRKPTMELGKDPVLNKTQTIYYSYEDIPASDIADVYIWGEYGFEYLKTILDKIKEGTVKSNKWTNQFGRMFF